MEYYDKVGIKNPSNFEMEILNATTKRHFYIPKNLAKDSLSDNEWIALATKKGFIKSLDKKEKAKNHLSRTIKVWKTFKSGNERIENLIFKQKGEL